LDKQAKDTNKRAADATFYENNKGNVLRDTTAETFSPVLDAYLLARTHHLHTAQCP